MKLKKLCVLTRCVELNKYVVKLCQCYLTRKEKRVEHETKIHG